MSARHLVLDLGGVLFRFDHARRLDRLAAELALPRERVDALLWKSGFSADCDTGRYADAAQVRARIRELTGFAGGDERLDAAWCSAFRPDPRVYEILQPHRGSRPFALFTNNGPLEEEALPRRYPAAFEGFGQLLFSHRLGRRKPDPAAFGAALRRLGAEPGEVLFLDDSAANVDAARRLGWTAFRFRGPDDLARALRS
ncbi:HAD family hydrolase [Streptomyces hoynatensis]|uniref:HAD family phosphatase n=1 Tax=Streptomyces hoynatensis TaxID=1141874 RepID=A0A3A9Z992_9ACTN|nr:HAD family phosphatase [Streptomyces hoynatensis]RKN45002.1 HAD family phosphatase [Streptomyces hoynatensis]